MKRVIAPNGTVYYRSELLSCPHGFSTRIGGVSTRPHTATMNLAFDRGDEPETVLENLRRFAEGVGIEAARIISVSQIHSAKVRYVTPEHAGEGFFREETCLCDGYVTDRRGIAPAVRTADCVPILLYAPPTTDFSGAIAALHAGWRGTAAGIGAVAVEQMKSLGARPETIRCAIGPSIGPCCYEVREDFVEAFSAMAGDSLCKRYVLPCEGRPGVYRADLRAVNQTILLRAGLRAEHMDIAEHCTACRPEEFFSHRYSGGVRGTMLSVISLTDGNDEESR